MIEGLENVSIDSFHEHKSMFAILVCIDTELG